MAESSLRKEFSIVKDEEYDLNIVKEPDDDEKRIYDELQEFRSKYKEPLLQYIYEKEEVSNKDLRSYLDITPSGLNPIITRLLELTPAVIQELPRGRKKFYRLTENARRAIDAYDLLPDMESVPPLGEMQNELLQMFKEVQDCLGENWEFQLDEYYVNGSLENAESEASIAEFEDELKYTILNQEAEKFEKLKTYIHNNILTCRLEIRAEQLTDTYRKMKILCELDDKNSIDAMRLLDEACKEIAQGKGAAILKKTNEKYGVADEEEFVGMLTGIEEIYKRTKKLKKLDIFSALKDEFPEQNQKLVFYMAEKFQYL